MRIKIKLYNKRSLILLGLIILAFYISFIGSYGAYLQSVEGMLSNYITNHAGRFPETEEDMSHAAEINGFFNASRSISVFIIRYGSSVDNLSLSDNKIVDKEGRAVLLIGALPKNLWLDVWLAHWRRSISIDLFKEMQSETKKQQNEKQNQETDMEQPLSTI